MLSANCATGSSGRSISEQFEEAAKLRDQIKVIGMTLDLSLLPDGGVTWLDASGEHAGIVLSTRIRLARNLEGYRVHRAGA